MKNGQRNMLDEAIGAQEATVAQLKAALRRARGELSQLRAMRKRAERVERVVARAARPPVVKSAAAKAGKANVDAARAALKASRRLTGVEIRDGVSELRGRRVNDGTVVYAIRALVEEGVAVKTGERVRGSDVFEYVPRRRHVTRPGDQG